MLVGFRLYPLSFDFSATGQISARQVDAACKNLLRGPLREGKTLLRRLPREAESLLRGQIDALVYDLYGLTAEEIKNVKGVTT